MSDILDGISKALASGASRRAALGGALAGAASTLPWMADAKRRNRNKSKKFKKLLRFCQDWCGSQFMQGTPEFTNCVKKAKEGKGPCYSATEQGPGHFCTKVQPCGKKTCCPNTTVGPVTEGECCDKGEACMAANGTFVFCSSV